MPTADLVPTSSPDRPRREELTTSPLVPSPTGDEDEDSVPQDDLDLVPNPQKGHPMTRLLRWLEHRHRRATHRYNTTHRAPAITTRKASR